LQIKDRFKIIRQYNFLTEIILVSKNLLQNSKLAKFKAGKIQSWQNSKLAKFKAGKIQSRKQVSLEPLIFTTI